VAPPAQHGLALSSVLLLDEPEDLPVTVEEAAPHLRGTTEARSGERIALFWETYGLTPADLPLAVGVELLDENAGWLRRTAVRAGLVGQRTPLAVRWQEAPGEPEPVHGRSVVVELPELSAGSYTLQVSVTARGREPLRTAQRITVVE
jgi:hypothetical protein